MATITTRAGKGSPLTNTEVDSNFTNLNDDKLEAGDNLGTPSGVVLTNATGLPIVAGTTGTLSISRGGTGSITASGALTNFGLTATAAEINTLDGITATVTELNYTDGVTSSIQTQLNTKAPLASPTFTGTVTIPAATVTGNVSFGDNDKATFGAGSDLQIYHTGSASIVGDFGTGDLLIRGENLKLQNTAGENYLVGTNNDAIRLYYDNLEKLATTSTGIDVTGSVVADGLSLGDNDKAQFGAGNDLQIYHDGGNSLIEEAGVGNLIIRGSGNVDIQPSGGGAYMARFAASGASSLYYNGAQKLATTSTGIDVTGNVFINDVTPTLALNDTNNSHGGGSQHHIEFNTSGGLSGYIGSPSSSDNSIFITNLGGSTNASGTIINSGGGSIYLESSSGTSYANGEKIWTAGNDGTGSGLDADLLDGQQGSYYTGYTDTAIANLVDSAPATLDTLNELAAALGDDPNFATTVTNSIAGKVSKSGDTMSSDLIINSIGANNNAAATDNIKVSGYGIVGNRGTFYVTNNGTVQIGVGGSHNNNSAMTFGTSSNVSQKTLYENSNRVFTDGYHPNADTWTTARTLSLTGAVTGSVSMDGSGNVSLATTATADPTLTLSGDVTGSATFTNLGNATLTATVANDSHTHQFDNLTNKSSGTGTYATTGVLQSGKDSGGVALTINDGYGNANVTFNHLSGIPEQNGNAARIEVNTDASSTATMYFELKSGVTGGVAVQTDNALTLTQTNAAFAGTISATGYNDSNWDTAYTYSQVGHLPLSGGTVTGTLTLDNGGASTTSLVMKGTSPTISLLDDDTNADDFYIHVNSNIFYILANRTDAAVDVVGTDWETPHPMYLNASNNTGYVFGNRIFADDYHPNADAWTTARTISLTGAVTGSTSIDGSGNVSIATTATADPTLTLAGDASGSATFTNLGNATLTVTVADDSHQHSRLYENSLITYGVGQLQWTDVSGNGGTGANGGTPQNPTNDWYHHIITNHANSGGYYYDLSLPFHQDELFFRRVSNGNQGSFRKVWHDGNDGAGSGLDADLLDGQQGSYYTGYTDTAIANLVDSAPATLDTLNELAAALGDDPNFATTVTNSIATKLPSSSYTAADVLAKLLTVDGAGSGLDADLFDGLTSGAFVRSNAADTKTGYLEMQDGSANYIGLGNGSDFRMWHDGSNTIFRNYNHPEGDMIWQTEGTGGVVHTAMVIKGDTTTPKVELYFDSAKKLETNTGGVEIFGTATATTFSGALSGNATTATTLATARTINGVSFNGSANITVADATKLPLTGGTLTGDVVISKADAKVRLYDSTGTSGNNPFVEFDTTANQGIAIELNVYDAELPVLGYGLVVGPSTTNTQFPTTGTLSFNVLGEMYTGGTTLTSLNKVFHDGYHPNADTLTTARTINGVSFNGSANITVADATKLPLTGGTITGALTLSQDGQDVLNFSANDTNDSRGISFNSRTALSADYNDGYLRLNQLGEFTNGVYTPYVIRADGGFNGNATTATTLATARTINGVSFDGSSNITVADDTKLPLTGGTLTGNLDVNADINGVNNIYLGANLYHEGDTDTRLLFGTNTITLQTAGSSEVTINTTGVRLGDTGNGYFQPVTGSFGSIQIDGGNHGGYEGLNIGGRAVFMHNNADNTGIYNDVDNHWLVNCVHNGEVVLYYNGVSKIQTQSSGANVDGTLTATAFTGDGSGLTNLPASGGGATFSLF